MTRITINLPGEVALLLQREARHRGKSVSEVARQALLAYFGVTGTQPRRIPFAASVSSGYWHTARDIEEILAEESDRDRGG